MEKRQWLTQKTVKLAREMRKKDIRLELLPENKIVEIVLEKNIGKFFREGVVVYLKVVSFALKNMIVIIANNIIKRGVGGDSNVQTLFPEVFDRAGICEA